MIREGERNYECKGIKKFRHHVRRNCLSKPLDYYEHLPDYKTNAHLITKMFEVRNFLNEMFPDGVHPTIGSKFRYVNKNIFQNDFLLGIMNETTCQLSHKMFMTYFNVNTEESRY